MDFFDAVANRFSYRRSFDGTAVPIADLKKIVQAGLDAPSGKNKQTTGFIIIQNPAIVEKINRMPGANGSMATAPAYIAAHISTNPVASYSNHSFDIEDCAAAVENILLASTAMGYGTVWIDGWLRLDGRAEEIGKLCSLDPHRIIRILIPLGRAAEEQKRAVKKSFEERVTIV